MPDHQLLVLGYIPPDLRAALTERFALVELDRSRAEPWTGFDIAVTTGIVGAGAREFDACPDLRLVVSQGIGLETIDLAEARRRGIAVAHTPDEIAEDVGDAAIAMIYAVLRGTLRADAFVRQGRWGGERIAATRRVAGRTVGVVGLGRIGRHVADRAQAIGMRVLYHARSRKDAPYEHVADVVTLAARSDVLVLACPGGEETRHLVDAAVLDALGPDGVLVNVARGSVVDEPALLEALDAGRIYGAALDVFATEPAIDPRFLALDNVVLSPHSASITRETRAAIIARVIHDIDAYRTGRPFFDAARAEG
ncbi:2-hydroxyacid dehydrogenase [Rhodoplanes sp. TEM]|uniref:2-hydroxyacid dehydrogenase n=1 Tax=Rhodoplanes tepidamans TaxID=200616 RepID=A0ABT5J783_RHOTP|nr:MULTISPECIES: 2-hydroxyacid dehydrogenase [Rhodoplanes]MDC7785317.1 2-hydroxyacid dehydrogenase [Rhodoplanes tepidamans]MDC7987282.1 2-hydroxyacid dehydrogenase [Rhodoplanes sp. TEM]MDQ0353576.1 lactate dehydrogenase-like 2-hydroxyacid dehydrogenase [Rhodoplanes tepidamans]